jgi:hygromycin-B 7''-O-kinase
MLPAVRTDEEWQAVVFDETVVRPAAEDLAARLGLAGAGLRRYPGGSRPVYAVGDRRVLELYPRCPLRTSPRPGAGLPQRQAARCHARALAHGEYENGWRCVLMSQLRAPGWRGLVAIPRPHQDRVASQVGEMLAALHALDPEPRRGITARPTGSAS